MKCSKCGHQNLDDAGFCARCGSALETYARVAPPSVAQGAQANYSLMREAQYDVARNSGKSYAVGKNPFIATMLSMCPFFALGQLYNGDFKKAALVWFGYFCCFFLDGTAIGLALGIPLGILIWGFSVFDAHGVAKREKPVW